MAYTFYGAVALTGGVQGALDALDGALLQAGDRAFVVIPYGEVNAGSYTYILKDSMGGLLETVPSVIVPDVNAGNKRWELVTRDLEAVGPVANQGYFAGGQAPGAVATAELVNLSTGAISAQPSANLTEARSGPSGARGDLTKGYFAGGWTTWGTGSRVTTDKLTFSTNVTGAQTTANLTQARSTGTGLSEGTTKGYSAGGYTGSYVATADKITFSSDTAAAQTSANLSQGRFGAGDISYPGVKGYALGGQSSGSMTVADRLMYSSDVMAAQTSANLIGGRYGAATVSENTTKGYIAGGVNGSTVLATAEKVTFSTDTTAAVTSANLPTARTGPSGVSNGSSCGYLSGGCTDSAWTVPVTTIDKLTFSTDVTAAFTSATLSQARGAHAGLSACAV